MGVTAKMEMHSRPDNKPDSQAQAQVTNPWNGESAGSKASRKRSQSAGPDPAQLPHAKKLRRVGQLCDAIVVRQYELQHQEATLNHCGEFVEQSAAQLLRSSTSLTDTPNNTSQLTKDVSRLQTDLAALRTQLSLVQGLRHIIINLEVRLRGRIDKLTQPLPCGLADNNIFDSQLDQGVIESNTSSARSDSENETPSLVAEYYDRKGDIGVFQDRLGELEYNYHEGLVRREMISDRGDQLSISDSQYNKRYDEDRRDILNDLEQAERDTEDLGRRCQAAGHDILRQRKVSSSDQSDHKQVAQTPPRMVFSTPLLQQPISASGHLEQQSSDNRVQDWLQSVQRSNSSPTQIPSPDIGSAPLRPKVWRSYSVYEIATAASWMLTQASPSQEARSHSAEPTLRRWKTDPGATSSSNNEAKPVTFLVHRSPQNSDTAVALDKEVASKSASTNATGFFGWFQGSWPWKNFKP